MRQKKKTVIDFFEEQVLLHPDDLAVVCNNEKLTYQDLNKKANYFRDILINDYSIVPGDYVALNIRRKSSHVISAILGILKASAVFLPINSDHPQATIDNILSSTGARLILNECSDYDKGPDQLEIKILTGKSIGLRADRNIAYSMYTSGTSGKPKGVSITHENLVATYLSWLDIYRLSREDNHLQMANISFDVFTGDWVRALCSGGTLVLCQTDELLYPEMLFQKIVNHNITVAEFVPATLNRLISYVECNGLALDKFRLLLCGSDLWSVKEAKKAVSVCGKSTTIYNSYGLTETTIDSTYFHVTEKTLSQLDDASIVPIGVPFPHVTVSIRDEHFVEVPVGTMGELVIGGKGVSPYGYINAPDLTQQRFVCDKPLGAMLYRTGDVAKIKLDGCIEFQGRNELQININGKRVELPNVEYAITKHENIKSAIVSPTYSETGQLQLIAYVVLKKEGVSKLEIQQHLEKLIPFYAVPHRFYEIEELPLTMNGKINRKVPSIAIRRELEANKIAISDPLEKEIMSVWSELLGVTSVPLSSSFQQAGGTSLLYVEMLEVLNKKYNVPLGPCMQLSTIPEIAEKIRLSQRCLESKSLDFRSSSAGFFRRTPIVENSLCSSNPYFLQKRFFSAPRTTPNLVNRRYFPSQAGTFRPLHSIFKFPRASYVGGTLLASGLAISSFLCRK